MSEPHHSWGDRVTVMDGTPSGCEETERRCPRCGLVKITVHPPQGVPWRAWRTKAGIRTDKIAHTPPCLSAAELVAFPPPSEVAA